MRDCQPLTAAGRQPYPQLQSADLNAALVPMPCREVALEEFEDFSNVADAVFVRIANIPLQESLRDLR